VTSRHGRHRGVHTRQQAVLKLLERCHEILTVKFLSCTLICSVLKVRGRVLYERQPSPVWYFLNERFCSAHDGTIFMNNQHREDQTSQRGPPSASHPTNDQRPTNDPCQPQHRNTATRNQMRVDPRMQLCKVVGTPYPLQCTEVHLDQHVH
jgi:hypothetical protein